MRPKAMQGRTLNAVDMSRWSGELTNKEAECMKKHGIQLVIANIYGRWARQQMEAALAAGMRVDAYVYLYWDMSPTKQMQDAAKVCRGLDVMRLWADCESLTGLVTNSAPPVVWKAQRDRLEGFLDAALNEGDRWFKLPCGIYTGRWWWNRYMLGVTKYSNRPLWNAWYDGDPDQDGLPYGGWTFSSIEQYKGTTRFCGQSVDLNHATKEYLEFIEIPLR